MNRRDLLWCSLFFVTGCTAATGTRTTASSVTLPETLRFAVTEAGGLEELQDYKLFQSALAAVLETQVEFFPVEGMVATVPAMQAGQVDLAWAGPSEYVLLAARAKAIPVVALNRLNYRSVIVVNSNSSIKSLQDLTGQSLGIFQTGSTAHLGAVKLLLNAGLKPADIKTVTLGDRNLARLKTDQIQALATSLPNYHEQLQKEGLTEQDYPLLSQSPLLPGDVFAVSSRLGSEVAQVIRSRILQRQDKLMQAVLSSAALARFRDSTFTNANDADYDMIREAYRAIGQEEVIQ